IGAVAAGGLSTLKSNLLEDRKAKLQDLVRATQQALDFGREPAKKAGLSEAEMLERSKTLLRSLRFGKDNDYFYALDM
ncbi:cache domain-containing protein, partial [Mycobacterium tuberculosis]|nr:cache domain-containing protein [Mycobacterium tuberculosis]